MPVSSRPSDKFAFLLTGPTTARYMQDLKNVFDTLTGFYNFPAANIWVVQGSNTFQNPGDFTGANMDPLDSGGDPLQNLKDIFHSVTTASFIKEITDHIAGDPPPAGEYCTVVLYFTGCRDAASATLDLVIRPGSGSNEITLSSADLIDLIQYPRVGPTGNPALRECLLNVIMQQDYCGSYNSSSALSGNILINNRCFTFACGDSESSAPGAAGGQFTETWVKGLQWAERLDNPGLSGDPVYYNKYSDQIPPMGDLFHINLEQACEFAKKRAEVANYGFYQALNGETAMYLGKPVFLIQDGDPYWWATPDIYLTHLLIGDTTKHTNLYIPDTISPPTINNRINVAVRNIGTHPVRSYRIGVRVYGTPADGVLVTQEVNGQVPEGIVLKPAYRNPIDNSLSNDNHDLFKWDTPFYEGTTHECVWAKVQLPTDDVALNPFDFSWHVTTKDEEAQRNTDEGYDPPRSASGKLAGDSFRGNKQHVFRIQNPFKETHKFIICSVPEFQRSLNSAVINWYSGADKKRINLKFVKIEKGYSGFSFILKGGETKIIIGEFRFKPEAKDKRVSFPVEILVDRITGSETRKPIAPSLQGKFAALTGFTIILRDEAVNLICSVVDKNGKPVPDSVVRIQTVNRLAEENIKVNNHGEISLKSINPDVYRIKARAKTGESVEKIVPVFGREAVKVKLEIILPHVKPVKKR